MQTILLNLSHFKPTKLSISLLSPTQTSPGNSPRSLNNLPLSNPPLPQNSIYTTIECPKKFKLFLYIFPHIILHLILAHKMVREQAIEARDTVFGLLEQGVDGNGVLEVRRSLEAHCGSRVWGMA
jgi:hypothetical protein